MRARLRAAAQRVLGAAGSLGLLLVAGWTAADATPEEPRDAFTLAPIMATRSTGGTRPARPAARQHHGAGGAVAVAR